MLDARRTLVVGLALMTGLAAETFPNFFHAAPASIEPLVASPLVLGTFVGFLLNAAFHIGMRRRADLQIDPEAVDLGAVQNFMEGIGGAWGRAVMGSRGPPMLLLEARYVGGSLALPNPRPSPTEIADTEDGARRLARVPAPPECLSRILSAPEGDMVVQFRFHN
jgi:xanthine permease XanP